MVILPIFGYYDCSEEDVEDKNNKHRQIKIDCQLHPGIIR